MGHNLEPETVEEAIDRVAGTEPGLEEENGPDGGPGPESSDNGTPSPSGDDAIAFVEMVNVGVVVGVSKLRGIKVDERVMELTRFTQAERDQLKPYAPYAAPYLHQISQHSEAFMAMIFVGMGALTVFSHLRPLAGIQMSQGAQIENEEEVMKNSSWSVPPGAFTPKWKAGDPGKTEKGGKS